MWKQDPMQCRKAAFDRLRKRTEAADWELKFPKE
jgi:hypothetical protein